MGWMESSSSSSVQLQLYLSPSSSSHPPILKPPNILCAFQSPAKCLLPLKLARSRHRYLLPLVLTHPFTLPALAADSPPQLQKINLEAIVVSIDDFFIKYPFFVTLVGVIWLVLIPLAQYYISKFKYTSALAAFQKLRDDPNAALLDIRDHKSVAFLPTPDLTLLNKTALHLHFDDQDDSKTMLFVNTLLHNFQDPSNAVVCVIDNFDGNSLKVAELLVKNGFKEAYAIKGGVRGKKGWQEIQEDVFPPSVHVYQKTKIKSSKQKQVNEKLETNFEN
uniref:Rhodanese domain-containing protein n=1 Tax=Kalanchoe fedtschenkoi TaxID=63787 RepID=A0A7N0UNE1_KALFE